MIKKRKTRQRRIARIRAKVAGTKEKPRIAVFRSNKAISAQAINDVEGVTIAAVSDVKLTDNITRVEKAKKVGLALGEKLIKLGVKKAVFDRRGYKYHGRIKALAEGIREGGVDF